MEFFEAVNLRRSVRKYTDKPVPPEVINRALDAALRAPNSSNVQTWDFYWVRSPEKKSELVKYCLNQSSARQAQELIVVAADPGRWKRSYAPLVQFTEDQNSPPQVKTYYKKLVPLMYTWGFLNAFALPKWFAATLAGLFRPLPRGPFSKGAIQTVCIKSAALAAENFVLAISAQGFATCMMEGFDECRVSKLLKLSSSARILMVISVGEAAADGIFWPQYRLPREQVVHEL